MKKRLFLAVLSAILGITTTFAQQIAVVSGSGSTSVYQTLTKAIEGASDGSTIYLPGGGFQINDSVKITKRLTIIGIGHKAKSDNVDGNTTISGNLWFNEGSSGSAIMGCYISGNVNIGDGGASVNNITIKYCNLNSVGINNNTCTGTIVNQNYIRNECGFNYAEVTIKNNILYGLYNIDGGTISNNIIKSSSAGGYRYSLTRVNNSSINNNVFLNIDLIHSGNNCVVSANMLRADWGDDCVNIGDADWNTVFTKYNNGAITPASEFKFSEDYQQYSDCGIYGGDGFSDGQLPPVPFIVAKSIPEQTDASGNLNIKIRVKAGE